MMMIAAHCEPQPSRSRLFSQRICKGACISPKHLATFPIGGVLRSPTRSHFQTFQMGKFKASDKEILHGTSVPIVCAALFPFRSLCVIAPCRSKSCRPVLSMLLLSLLFAAVKASDSSGPLLLLPSRVTAKTTGDN